MLLVKALGMVGFTYTDIIPTDISVSGGRRSTWVRNWYVWTQIRDYFPITVSVSSLAPFTFTQILGIYVK